MYRHTTSKVGGDPQTHAHYLGSSQDWAHAVPPLECCPKVSVARSTFQKLYSASLGVNLADCQNVFLLELLTE